MIKNFLSHHTQITHTFKLNKALLYCLVLAHANTSLATPLNDLQRAARKGDTTAAIAALRAGANINGADGTGRTALHHAIENGQLATMNLLLDKGANPNATTSKKTPLYLSIITILAKAKVISLMEYDLKCVPATNEQVVSRIKKQLIELKRQYTAYLEFRKTATDILINRGADINMADWDGRTPLDIAVEHGALDIVKDLAAHGAEINATTTYGTTPLHTAAYKGNKSMVQFLIEHGAFINAATKNQYTPLQAAIRANKPSIVQFLLEHGAKIPAIANGTTPIQDATMCGNTDILQQLLAAGANINAADETGSTPLFYAIEHASNPKIILWLLDHGANVHATDCQGNTPLHAAAFFAANRTDIIQILIDNGADAQVRNNDGKTPNDIATDPAVKAVLLAAKQKTPEPKK